MVDVFLRSWVGEGKTQRQLGQVFAFVVGLDELLQAVGDVLPQLLGGASLELLRHPVLGLGDIKASLLFCQGNLANAQVGPAHVESQEGALLFAVWEAHDPGYVHWLIRSVYQLN